MKIETDNRLKYGILLSGGIDSAVLLYLIIKNNPFVQIQPYTIAKKDGAILYADPIIDHFNKKFKLTIPYTIVVGDPTVYHRLQSKTAVRDIFQNHDTDILFIGINQNPPELKKLKGAPLRSQKSDNPKIMFPFVDLYKDAILKIMIDEDQLDLADITHSCTEQQVGRCNRCWQCTERTWAFKQLDLSDTGKK